MAYEYAVPGEAVRLENDIDTRFVKPFENYLTRQQQEKMFNAKLAEERRRQNVQDLQKTLEFKPNAVRGEYQPYFFERMKEFVAQGQKTYRGDFAPSEADVTKLAEIQNGITAQANMVNQADARIRDTYEYMLEENQKLSAAGKSPKFNLNYSLEKLNSLFRNEDGSVRDPEQIDFNQMDSFFADSRTRNLGAQAENFLSSLPLIGADIMEEVPSKGGNPAWKLLNITFADLFETEIKDGLVVPKLGSNGKPVPKVSNELLYLISTTDKDYWDDLVEESELESRDGKPVPVGDIVKRHIDLYMGELYKQDIDKIQNITNPYAYQASRGAQHEADVTTRVKSQVSQIANRDPAMLGIIKATRLYQGRFPITDVKYATPEGPFQPGETPRANAIQITYQTEEFGIPQTKTATIEIGDNKEFLGLLYQTNALQNAMDEGTGKSVTSDEFLKKYRDLYPNGPFGNKEVIETSPTNNTDDIWNRLNKK